MGADWHVWLVKDIKGIWTPTPLIIDTDGYAATLDCFCGRNYYLFGEVGGVRGSAGKTAFRGWPDNIHDSIKEVSAKWSFHSLTHLSIKEMEKAFNKVKIDLPLVEIPLFTKEEYGNDYRAVKKFIELEECEALLLGLKKPKFKLLVAFDS